MGPVAYLKGEITVVDGKAYRAVVAADGGMEVAAADGLTAPFFGYANIAKWRNVPLPDSVVSLPQLEAFLLHGAGAGQGAYFFRLTAVVATANVHIVNLPAGRKVSSPEEAHEGQKNYNIKTKEVELIGFFSTAHQTIFTKHDTYLHVHLITADRQQMGHLEELQLKAGTARLYLPE
jgi:acetolactate decarboxylase